MRIERVNVKCLSASLTLNNINIRCSQSWLFSFSFPYSFSKIRNLLFIKYVIYYTIQSPISDILKPHCSMLDCRIGSTLDHTQRITCWHIKIISLIILYHIKDWLIARIQTITVKIPPIMKVAFILFLKQLPSSFIHSTYIYLLGVYHEDITYWRYRN